MINSSTGISDTLRQSLSDLQNFEETFMSSGRLLLTNRDLFLYDLLCTAVLNRSLNLVRGFILLMQEQNFIAAAPLIRVHFDTLLRLHAFSLIDQDSNQLTLKIIQGDSIRNLKGRDGISLTDKNLVESISREKKFKWIKPLYGKLSGFVHFSDMHILASSSLDAENGIIQGAIRRSDEFIPENDKLASISFMIMISEAIESIVGERIEQKASDKKETS